MIYAVIAAVVEAVYVIGNKKYLSLKERFNYPTFLVVTFFFFFVLGLISFPWLGSISVEFLQVKYYLLLLLLVLVVATWNYLYYKGLHEESLVEFELITMVYPVAAVFLAGIFIPREFSLHVFIAGIVASLVLVATHIQKHHIQFDKMQLNLLYAVILMAFEAVIVRYLLDVMSPIALYTIRTGLVFCIFACVFRDKIKIKFNQAMLYQFILAILGMLFVVFQYHAFILIGVGFTILVLLLHPILNFLYAHFELKEPLPAKKIVAIVVIIACIIYAYLLG